MSCEKILNYSKIREFFVTSLHILQSNYGAHQNVFNGSFIIISHSEIKYDVKVALECHKTRNDSGQIKQ